MKNDNSPNYSPKTSELFDPISMNFKSNNNNSNKKTKIKKGDYFKKLEDENSKLKDIIKQISQHINTIEAQNSAIQQQLQFFQGFIPDEKNLEKK